MQELIKKAEEAGYTDRRLINFLGIQAFGGSLTDAEVGQVLAEAAKAPEGSFLYALHEHVNHSNGHSA